MLIISFGLWGIGDMLRVGGRSTRSRPCRRHAHPDLWLGRRHLGHRSTRCATSSTASSTDPASDRPAAGTRAGAALRPACARARGGRAARRARPRHPGVRPGRRATTRCGPRSRAIRPSRAPAARSTPCSTATACSRRASREAAVRRRRCAARSPPTSCSARCVTEGLAPKSLRDDIFKMEGEKRIAETLYIPDAIITDVPKPTAEQLNAYFDANKAKFQIPEFRAFSYVLLTVDDVMAQVAGDARAGQAGVRGALRRVRHAGEARRRPGDGRQRGQGQGDHRAGARPASRSRTPPRKCSATPTA